VHGQDAATSLVALAIVRSGRLALFAGGAARWQREIGCTLVPLELPGGALAGGEPVEAAAARLGTYHLGCQVRVRSSRWVYAPSDRHAVDRRPPLAGEQPAPLVLLSRLAPESGDGHPDGLMPVTVRILQTECVEEPRLSGRSTGVFELPLAAVRAVVRGVPLGEVLALAGVQAMLPSDNTLPDDAVLYLPSDYGERYLLRVVAKYGEQAIAVAFSVEQGTASRNEP
jgi:hypothetical protein